MGIILKKIWYNMNKKPFIEGIILDKGQVIIKIIEKITGQEYIKWKTNAWLLPKDKDSPLYFKEKFGTSYLYSIENALFLQYIPQDKPQDSTRLSQDYELSNGGDINRNGKCLMKNEFITYLNPNTLKDLLEEHSLKDIIAPETNIWETLRPVIIIGMVLFMIWYLLYFFYG